MNLQIGDDLKTVHNAQPVYSNRQDIVLTLLTGFNIWLAHNCQTEEDHLNIKIVTALLLYNACTLLNMMEKQNLLRDVLIFSKIDPLGLYLLQHINVKCIQAHYKSNS